MHGISKGLEWAAISFSRGSSQPRDRTRVSCIADRCFTIWATREAHLKVYLWVIYTNSPSLLKLTRSVWISNLKSWLRVINLFSPTFLEVYVSFQPQAENILEFFSVFVFWWLRRFFLCLPRIMKQLFAKYFALYGFLQQKNLGRLFGEDLVRILKNLKIVIRSFSCIYEICIKWFLMPLELICKEALHLQSNHYRQMLSFLKVFKHSLTAS